MHINELKALKKELIESISRLYTYLENKKIKGSIDIQRAHKTIINLKSHLHTISQCISKPQEKKFNFGSKPQEKKFNFGPKNKENKKNIVSK